MFPTQPKKWPSLLIGIVLLLLVIKHPEASAEAIQSLASSLDRFVNAF